MSHFVDRLNFFQQSARVLCTIYADVANQVRQSLHEQAARCGHHHYLRVLEAESGIKA